MKIAENPFGPTTEQECRQKKFITWQLLNVQNWICDYNIHQPHLNQTEKKKAQSKQNTLQARDFWNNKHTVCRYLDWQMQRMQ